MKLLKPKIGIYVIAFILLLGSSIQIKSLFQKQEVSAQAQNFDWPQVQNNPQHTGYSPEVLGTNISVAWTHPFQPDKVYPQIQPIIYQGKVYVTTEGANGKSPSVYALNATTGAQAWQFIAGGPILASVAADNNKIYFGAMDGAVYAVDANTGTQIWKKQVITNRGFSTAPVVADNKIMLGGRDGKFYALDPNNGNILWQYDTGSYILQTAAYNNGKVFFGAMDMRAYALNSSNGTLAWKSAPLRASVNQNGKAIVGMGFRDYWPMIHQGKVIFRPVGVGEMTSATAVSNFQANSACLLTDPNDPNFLNCPQSRTMFVFDETTGADIPTIHFFNPRMHGAIIPPCVTRDYSGDSNPDIVVPIGGWSTQTWGVQDLQTGTIVKRFTTRHNNGDENENITCSSNLIFIIHTSGIPGAAINGFYNLNNDTWTEINEGKQYWEMSNNTQGGGGTPVSIANGLVYHIGYHELVVWQAQ